MTVINPDVAKAAVRSISTGPRVRHNRDVAPETYHRTRCASQASGCVSNLATPSMRNRQTNVTDSMRSGYVSLLTSSISDGMIVFGPTANNFPSPFLHLTITIPKEKAGFPVVISTKNKSRRSPCCNGILANVASDECRCGTRGRHIFFCPAWYRYRERYQNI